MQSIRLNAVPGATKLLACLTFSSSIAHPLARGHHGIAWPVTLSREVGRGTPQMDANLAQPPRHTRVTVVRMQLRVCSLASFGSSPLTETVNDDFSMTSAPAGQQTALQSISHSMHLVSAALITLQCNPHQDGQSDVLSIPELRTDHMQCTSA